MKGKPKASICMITYNHEKYIKEAIEGVLMQKTNFSIELIIGEDFSSDNTRKICEEFEQLYPDKINLLPTEKNYGMMPNFIRTLNACTGKYIAFCEGDDYWTDPLKLQKQVDFLEANNEYGMICTNYHKLFMKDRSIKKSVFNKYLNEISFEEYVFDRSTIGTQTVLIYNKIVKNYFKEIRLRTINKWNVGDTPLWLYTMINFKVKVFSESTAVYRILKDSACHFTDSKKHYEFVMKGFEIPEYFLEKYRQDIRLKRRLEVRKQIAILNYAYKTSDKQLFNITYKKLKKLELKPKTILWKIGIQNRYLKRIINVILK